MKHIVGFNGLGDCVYSRPFVREAATWKEEIYFSTPWPELFKDIKGIKFVNPNSYLRTQKKNTERKTRKWHVAPDVYQKDRITLWYDDVSLMVQGSVIRTFENLIPLKNTKFSFDLPAFSSPKKRLKIRNKQKIAVIRPVTLRKEWLAQSRSPDPQYINWYANKLHDEGYFVVSVADLEPNKEWIVGRVPPANLYLHHGELSITELVGLVQHADVVVGGVGMILPIALASCTPLICVLGGRGEYDNPIRLTDPRMRGLNNAVWAIPDRFCICPFEEHDCNKNISLNRLESAWDSYLRIDHDRQRVGAAKTK